MPHARVLVVLAAISGTVLSGCIGGDGDVAPAGGLFGPLLPPPSGTGLAFAPAMELALDTGYLKRAIEPSVAADGNGNVYVTAARGIILGDPPQSSFLWVSNDGGTSFRSVSPVEGATVNSFPEGAEGHLDVNAEGIAYYVELTLAGIPVSRTTDGGVTWELRTPAANLVPVGDREWVAAGPGDEVYVAWNQIPSGYWVMGSEDGGRTWPVQTPFPGTGEGADLLGVAEATPAGVIAAGPEGNVYAVRAESEGPAVYASKDGARSFTRAVAWPAQGRTDLIFPTITTDAAGTVYVTAVESVDGLARTRYAYSIDGGATFSPPREVSTRPGTHALAWSAAGPKGTLAVAFYETSEEAATPTGAAGEWFVRVAVSRVADTPEVVFDEARVTEKPVYDKGICTDGLNCQSGRDLGDYMGVEVDPAGGVHVAWIDASEGDGKAFYRRTA